MSQARVEYASGTPFDPASLSLSLTLTQFDDIRDYLRAFYKLAP